MNNSQLRYVFFIWCILQIGNYRQGLAQSNDFFPGYVVALNNDTLTGLIQVKDRSFNSENCVFKDSSGNNQKTYQPGEIISYFVGTKGNFYSYSVSGNGQKRNVFLECLVNGKVSLYHFDERYFIEAKGKVQELVVTKSTITEGDRVFTRELPLYKGILQTEMNDCSTIHQNINKTALTKKALTQLFSDYHKCIGEDFITFESDDGKINMRFGLSVGVVASSLNISSGGDASFIYLDNEDPMQDVSFAPSLLVEFTRAGKKNKVRFRSGLSYYSNQYELKDEDPSANLNRELTIEYARLELPVLLKYYPLKSNQGLYAIAGIGFNAMIKWEDREIVTVPPSYVLSDSSPLENSKFFTNILGGLGFEFKLGGRLVFAETSYAWGPLVLSASKFPTGTITGFTFSAGVLF
jgi:hypothetical protein